MHLIDKYTLQDEHKIMSIINCGECVQEPPPIGPIDYR